MVNYWVRPCYLSVYHFYQCTAPNGQTCRLGTSASYPSAIALLNKKYAEQSTTVPGDILRIRYFSASEYDTWTVLAGVHTQFR
jgi:hypothetical protein